MNTEDVNYFVGSKAVDSLMESKWSSKKASKKNPPLFTDRQSCVDYMQQLLMKGLFFRAKKLVPKIKEKSSTDGADKKKGPKKGVEPKEETPKPSPKVVKETEVKRRKKDKGSKDEEEKSSKEKEEKDDEKENGDKGKEKSSKRKVRLDFHAEQLFIDGASIYVWKYDPTSMKTFLLGLGIVVGAIALCLFPLWPLQIRAGVYYLSLGAMGFFGAFIGLVALRSVLFGIVWAVTFGRHHFWLLPNLTEDCGVMESFKPWYSHKYYPAGTKPTEEDKKKKSKKSDSEDEAEGAEEEDVQESKDGQAEEEVPVVESESENENEDDRGKDGEGESMTGSQDDVDDNDDKTGASSDEGTAHTSSDEEARTSREPEKSPKKRRAVRRDDGQESNNGDFEFVENPKDD